MKLFIITFSLMLALNSQASQIHAIPLTKVEKFSNLIVLGKVTNVVKDGIQDTVTIEASCFLKGTSKAKKFSFTLTTRGGLKDFDPALKVGQSGVFFLNHKEEKGQTAKAYWGSIATFSKDAFEP